MNKTSQMKKLIFVIPALMTGLTFPGHVKATEDLMNAIFTLYPNIRQKDTGNAIECKGCHVGEYPPLLGETTLLPNVQDAYNADKVNYTGSVNLYQGCPAGTTANATQPWVCEGATPTPIPTPTSAPTPTPAPTPTIPIACDDTANTPSCQKQANQYGTLGTADNGAEVLDSYKVRCGRNTKSLKISVSDLAPDNPATISIQAFKGSAKSKISTDAVDGDGGYSPAARLAKGSGVYLVKVKKANSDTLGAELYDAQIQCVGGRKTQTAITIKESQ